MASDAFIVGEGWLSEHFFTTDAKSQSFQALVAARRKEWDELEASNHPTSRSLVSAFRTQLEGQLAELQAGSADQEIETNLYLPLREVLGFVGGSFTLETQGPVTRVSTPGIVDGAPLVLISARPVDALEDLLQKDEPTLLVPFEVDDNENHNINSVSRLLSTLFIEDEGPNYALVFAGKWMLIAERERWPEGRYLAVDLQLVAQRNDQKKAGEVDRALTCISAESLGPDAEGDIWWNGVLEESIKHTVGVSKDLREGVRLSIEIIANDVVKRRLRAGLPPLPASEAQTLAKQSLRFLYRILFLLFAEASPELKVLPVGASEYEEGYSLDRLRELTLVPLVTETAENGTHFYQSLAVLFDLVDRGHGNPTSEEESVLPQGLVFNGLKADLFLPKATSLIDEVMLSDSALQQVLTHLLLSKEQKGKDRGFISYADLGINQLGAVYEGLMSYTGFFAETPLYEVAKDGDASKGSWVVPTDRAQGLDPKDFVKRTNPITGEEQPVIHEQGSFVFRLAGRERQQSASYYTPEVLTRFTVSQALEELLDQDGETTTAEEILKLTVCEPALGSGAFAIEAVRQLAEEYLKRRQDELGERIAPEDYPQELQRVKAYIALHNVYGVDLNATAVELAEITLWLETMSDGLDAPWFGLHLRRGNSLIGARGAFYTRDQVASKQYLKVAPNGTLDFLKEDHAQTNGIAHFLLPAEGWGSAAGSKDIKVLGVEGLERLKAWRKEITQKISKNELDRLESLSARVKILWNFAHRRLRIAETEIQRFVPVWGYEQEINSSGLLRDEIELKLNDPNSPYKRLRMVQDAWCAMWYWSPNLKEAPPSINSWLDALEAILGKSPKEKKTAIAHGQIALNVSGTWVSLGVEEESDMSFAGVKNIDEVIQHFPWLKLTSEIAEKQGFFHWELDFASIFTSGGFDLQIGNPPWVRPRVDMPALLAEGNPWWQLAIKPTQAELVEKKNLTLQIPGITHLVVEGIVDVVSTSSYLGSECNFPILTGLQPDLYRCFMALTWDHCQPRGVVGLIHPESHFTDEAAGPLRKATYLRLLRHWQFINELVLFEIDHHVSFGVHIYGSEKPSVSFEMAASLYHPDTVSRSYKHDGTGQEPGLKDEDGKWDLRPHALRITQVDDSILSTWHAVLEDQSKPILETRMLYAVSQSILNSLSRISAQARFVSTPVQYSTGWVEGSDNVKGYFDVEWGVPKSWEDAILQGPHIHVWTPFYKFPNQTLLNNADWTLLDLETLESDFVPPTAFKPTGLRSKYDEAYTFWPGPKGSKIAARDHYRVAWRCMAANTGERTLIPALIPPGPAHVDGITSLAIPGEPIVELVKALGYLGSLLTDFLVRIAPKSTIRANTINRLPFISQHELIPYLLLRTLKLNCLTAAYAPIWNEVITQCLAEDSWTGGIEYPGRGSLTAGLQDWSLDYVATRGSDRRQLQFEIDAIVALIFGVSKNELISIYRTQFPVLRGYDKNSFVFDKNGRAVPSEIVSLWKSGTKNEFLLEQLATTSLELPFTFLDREQSMSIAYDFFASKVRDHE